jgi:hypothetical protein
MKVTAKTALASMPIWWKPMLLRGYGGCGPHDKRSTSAPRPSFAGAMLDHLAKLIRALINLFGGRL